jgi:nucleoside-diphosphate-sugar epimerase
MEILITGGNGLLGRYLVDALIDRGDTVRVLAMPAEDTSWLEDRGVGVYRGDICRPETLIPSMQGVEAVFHLAAMMGLWRPMKDYWAVNVTGTENVCRTALREGVRRLVHISSSIVYGLALGRPADESFPLAPFQDPYPVTKAEADKLVQRLITQENLPAVIIRPDQFFGPGDRLHFGHIADRLRTGKCIVVGSGDNALPLVYITDVIRALLLALDSDRAVGQAYNITTDRPVTQRQFVDSIAREIGARPPRARIPYPVLYGAGYIAERVAMVSGSRFRPPTTRFGVAFLGKDSRCAIDKARRELGYDPQVDLHEGVRRTASWWLTGDRGFPAQLPSISYAAPEVQP